MSTPYRDPWAILGLTRDADDKAIKRAYRVKAKAFHPDHNKNSDLSAEELESRFADIARAYDSIKTAENRSRWLSDNEGISSPFGSGFDPDTSFPDLEDDILSTESEHPVGPMPASAQRQSRSAVNNKTLQITFAESYNGVRKDVEIEVDDVCSACGGSGAAPGYQPLICDVCHGTKRHQIGRVVSECAACNGQGFTIEKPCPYCISGLRREKRTFVVDIPPGVTQDYQIKLEGSRRGKLIEKPIIIAVDIIDSPIFQRNLEDPADLMIDVPISYTEAVLGASVKIPTPENIVKLRIPAATTSGKVFRIKGAGMPLLNNPTEFGNLYARALITVPENISSEEIKLIASLQKYQPSNLRSHLFDTY